MMYGGGGLMGKLGELGQSLVDTQKILKKEHGNFDERASFRPVFVDRNCTNTCTHIFGKQYFCSIKFNNFFEFRGSTSNPNGFRIVVLCFNIVAYTHNFLVNG